MSVAFRRESDEEHREPRFELPIPPGPNYVTPRGKAQIEARLEALRVAVTEATGEAIEPLRRDLRYWQTRAATAELAAPPADGTAGFATQVTYNLGDKTRTIEIVGDDEAAPADGRIAHSAPLARALAGASVDETVAFQGREDAITVVAVHPISD